MNVVWSLQGGIEDVFGALVPCFSRGIVVMAIEPRTSFSILRPAPGSDLSRLGRHGHGTHGI